MNLKIISAGAGSGKTYTLTEQMSALLSPKDGQEAQVRASGIIATTFTNKAAAELKERVRIKLLEKGLTKEADELGNAMIGTVHAIGVQLLKRFAFEAGVSPEVDIVADTDQQNIFNRSLANVISLERVQEIEVLGEKLGFNKSARNRRDWRQDLKQLTDLARSNNFDLETLEESKTYSIKSFFELLPTPSERPASYFNTELQRLLQQTINDVEENEDGTKGKVTLLAALRGMLNVLRNRGFLNWYDWARIGKLKVPKKSREDVEELQEFAKKHIEHPDFHAQIESYVSLLFDTAIAVLQEYEDYKKVRGLIDYIDMEVLILKLLDHPLVQEVLKDEIDLLLVDEFQDTNPIQLKIFLQLSEIANQSIWVGDPKQSIYGFRGAAPDLMKAVMDSTDNIENLPMSWRSREDLVHLSNGLFLESFGDEMPKERIALKTAAPYVKEKESPDLGIATQHWHFVYEGSRMPGSPWFEQCIASRIKEILAEDWQVRIKGSNAVRPLEAGDIAVLCRSNKSCQVIATALNKEGLKASISRDGLLQTAEASLLLACLRYILNKHDALAIAEILLLTQEKSIEEIIANRLDYLEELDQATRAGKEAWGHDKEDILILQELRYKSKELSTTEIVNSVIEQLDLRRKIVAWSNEQQRLDNIDAVRKLALDYEAACQRLHSAATLGGFLLWLDGLAKEGLDEQGKGAGKDAVNVLTYHKSKGLEWPVVICHSLMDNLRENIWGFRIVRTTDQIDIRQPLANRLLCYWINPYADQKQKTALEETVNNHPARIQAKKEALSEEARLMYVGITRARDYLIFPTAPKKPTKWLNRVFHKGQEELPSLDTQGEHALWLWEGQNIPMKIKHFAYEKNRATTVIVPHAIDYLEERAGAQDHFQTTIIEQAQSLFPNLDFRLGAPRMFSKLLPRLDAEELSFAQIQPVLATFIQADNPTDFAEEKRLAMARNLLEQHELQEYWGAAQWLQYSQQFYQNLHDKFSIKKIEKYKNFRYGNDKTQRYYTGMVDLVLSLEDDSLVLLQHLTQDIEKLGHNKAKIKEEVAALRAAASYWKEETGQAVSFGIVQLLRGQWRLIKLVKSSGNTQLTLEIEPSPRIK
ncbi:MAG: UvrD-helicase domain-containing protein [Aureispira sp.]